MSLNDPKHRYDFYGDRPRMIHVPGKGWILVNSTAKKGGRR